MGGGPPRRLGGLARQPLRAPPRVSEGLRDAVGSAQASQCEVSPPPPPFPKLRRQAPRDQGPHQPQLINLGGIAAITLDGARAPEWGDTGRSGGCLLIPKRCCALCPLRKAQAAVVAAGAALGWRVRLSPARGHAPGRRACGPDPRPGPTLAAGPPPAPPLPPWLFRPRPYLQACQGLAA